MMMAVDYEHEDVLTLLSRQKTIQLDIADSEGYRNDSFRHLRKDDTVSCNYLQVYSATSSC